jgi:hypothetical protein
VLGIDITNAVAGVLLLAAGPIECSVPKPPVINIIPTTEKVRFDYSKTTAELTAMQSDTVLPYAPNVDVTTGGLRMDRPESWTQIQWGYQEYPQFGAVCLWYDQIDIKIKLAPVVYIAKEFNKSKCRNEILKHELKHVEVDRIVYNDYAQQIGAAVEGAVNSAGALGPYRMEDMDIVRVNIKQHIDNAIASKERNLFETMTKKQQAVDSLEEYERISEVCADLNDRRLKKERRRKK